MQAVIDVEKQKDRQSDTDRQVNRTHKFTHILKVTRKQNFAEGYSETERTLRNLERGIPIMAW
jgi:hypothetical protein